MASIEVWCEKMLDAVESLLKDEQRRWYLATLGVQRRWKRVNGEDKRRGEGEGQYLNAEEASGHDMYFEERHGGH
ncbi:unnamed protein product [Fusarium graminearum]|uniref:Uncharacterized protein n=1 Tax=Gibberella zeae (strain ATCC MYA-4620 / CBS 123657 / FGSC 9075 / NRRL 31084 / PH-1) TaxID=229533 RepID=A0A098E484_GIBZE|nr:unnamed protein product [Fusarium graminearum]CZS84146.1 unnamed protein product [Fusarium graminearum]